VGYLERLKLPDGVGKCINNFFKLDLLVWDLTVRAERDHNRLHRRLSAFLKIQLKGISKHCLKQLEQAIRQFLLAKVFPERKLVRKANLSLDMAVSMATLAL
jgi:hypothetical protein